MTITETISRNIKRFREEKGWYQDELALKLGVTQKAVSAWETGKSCPRAGVVSKMCNLFGCSMTDILEEKQAHTENVENKTPFVEAPFEDSDEFMLKHLFKKLSIEQQHKIILEMLEMVSKK